MADSKEIVRGLMMENGDKDKLSFPVLIPNLKGKNEKFEINILQFYVRI